MNELTTGEMIKDLLEKKGKTQAQLSRYLSKCTGKEVSPNTVNRWIPNENNPDKKVIPPSGKYLPMIAEFFNVSVDIILGEAAEWDSKYHHMFCVKAFKHTEKYCEWLESLDYELQDNSAQEDEEGHITIETPTEMTIKWTDDNGFQEERNMKYVEFDMLMKHMEKLQRLVFEDYYEKWIDSGKDD